MHRTDGCEHLSRRLQYESMYTFYILRPHPDKSYSQIVNEDGFLCSGLQMDSLNKTRKRTLIKNSFDCFRFINCFAVLVSVQIS